MPVWVTGDGVIIDGHRRVNACGQLGITEIEAEVREYSDLLVIDANRYRHKSTTEILGEAEAL
jgi:ParB-like chromosome segregation protein Spo0J